MDIDILLENEIHDLRIKNPNNLINKAKNLKTTILKNLIESNNRISLIDYMYIEEYFKTLDNKPKDKTKSKQLMLIE